MICIYTHITFLSPSLLLGLAFLSSYVQRTVGWNDKKIQELRRVWQLFCYVILRLKANVTCRGNLCVGSFLQIKWFAAGYNARINANENRTLFGYIKHVRHSLLMTLELYARSGRNLQGFSFPFSEPPWLLQMTVIKDINEMIIIMKKRGENWINAFYY